MRIDCRGCGHMIKWSRRSIVFFDNVSDITSEALRRNDIFEISFETNQWETGNEDTRDLKTGTNYLRRLDSWGKSCRGRTTSWCRSLWKHGIPRVRLPRSARQEFWLMSFVMAAPRVHPWCRHPCKTCLGDDSLIGVVIHGSLFVYIDVVCSE